MTVQFPKPQLHTTARVTVTNIMFQKSDLQEDIQPDSIPMKFKVKIRHHGFGDRRQNRGYPKVVTGDTAREEA